MSDETALLRAIAAHPDEDTPRLAYADWLDEHGRHPRAAFIRGQIELARLEADSMHRRELAFHCRQLLEAHEQDWIEPAKLGSYDHDWSRGFLETITTTPSELELEANLFDIHPFRRVWLWHLNGKISGAELIPANNRITTLDLIGSNLNVIQLKKLAKLKNLPHLRELGLLFNRVRDTAVKVLCGEPFFQRLGLIRLGANPLTERGRDLLRAHFGDRVTFAHEREPERLYTIQNDYLDVGKGKEYTQILMLAGKLRQHVAVFDHAGNLLRMEARDVEQPANSDFPTRDANRSATRDKWFEELGFEPAPIRVKAFRFPHGARLTPFNWWAEAYEGRHDDVPHNTERSVRYWLEEGQFRFVFSENNDIWIDRTGEVTDT